uniref:CHCH domain-containing protein n=1 Tax=Leersia perrieri TaxID=77586 RepID=A0A0D9Y1U1_9ORYZ
MGWGMMSRAMDSVFGPRTINVVDATPPAAADACGAHNKAFQDCIGHYGNDIGRCQAYLDMLNDCRQDSAASSASAASTSTFF